MKKAYKVFTWQLCSPFRGGPPVWDGTLPYPLPPVEVDDSDEVCSFGWNAMGEPEDCLLLTGLWPDGWPVRLFEVEGEEEIIERGKKLRAKTWTVLRELGEAEIGDSLRKTVIGNITDGAAEEQLRWRKALSRPSRNPEKVREIVEELCGKRQRAVQFPDVESLEGHTGLPCDGHQSWITDADWREVLGQVYEMRAFDVNPWLRETAIWMPRNGWCRQMPWKVVGAFDAARSLTVGLAMSGGGWWVDPRVLQIAEKVRELYRNGMLTVSIVDTQGNVGWVMFPEEQKEETRGKRCKRRCT